MAALFWGRPGTQLPEPAAVVLHHHDGSVHHGADGDRDAAERHDVCRHALRGHDQERAQHAQRERDDDDEGGTQVQEEDDDHDGDRKAFLQQFAFQVLDRTGNQRRPVIDRDDVHAVGKAALEFGKLRLDAIDHVEGVLAVPHDHDPCHRLTLAVQFDDAAAKRRSLHDAGNVGKRHGRAVLRVDDHLFEIKTVLHVARGPNDELAFTLLEHPAADLAGSCPNGRHDASDGDVVGAELVGVDQHLILAHEPADRRDLCHAFDPGELQLQEPILQRTQFGEVGPAASVDQRVLEDPPDAGCVGADLRRGPGGQLRPQPREGLDHPGPAPVEVDVVLEDHVDEAGAEHGRTAHVLGPRQAEEIGGQRIRHQVLDDLRRLAGKIGADDDLGVREVRNRVERRPLHGEPAGGSERSRQHHHDDRIGDRPGDQLGHGGLGGIATGQAVMAVHGGSR